MQVSVMIGEGLERRLNIVVPSDQVEAEYKKKVQEFTKKAKIDGFRPGKVPASVVEKQYGASLRNEVLDHIMREKLFSAIQEQKLNPASRPTIESMKAEPGKDFEFEASLEIYPEVNLIELQGVEVEKVSAEITDQDIDTILGKLQKQHAEWVKVDRAAQADDQVTIDFDGYINGEQMKNGKAEGSRLVLGSNMMIPGFEDQIIGAKTGDELTIKVTFPAEYHEASLANQVAEFKIKLHEVQEPKLAALDDEFASKFGIKEGGIEALKTDLRKHMTNELKNLVKSVNKQKAFDALLAKNDILLPKEMIESEMHSLHEASHQQHDHVHTEHCNHEISEEEKSMLREPAQKRVKLGLLISELIKKHNLKPDAARVQSLIEELAGSYENAAEFVKWYRSDKARLAQVEMMAIEDMAVEKLLEGATIKEKHLNYEEMIANR